MKTVAALLLFACIGAAEDKRLDYHAKDAAIKDVVKRISDFFEIKLEIGDVAAKPVTIKFERATAPQALRALADTLGAKLIRLSPGRYRLDSHRNATIRSTLQQTKWCFVLPGLSLADVAGFLHRATRVPIALDPQAMARVSPIPDSTTVARILDKLTAVHGFRWDVRCGMVCIAPPKKLANYPRGSPFVLKRPGKHVSMATPLGALFERALRDLQTQSGVRIRLDASVPEKLRKRGVFVFATEASLADVLTVMLVPQGLTVVETDEGLVVKPSAK